MFTTTFVRRLALGATTAALAASGTTLIAAPAAQAAPTCKAYTVLALRGTNESGTLGTKLPTAISAFTSRKGGSTKVHVEGVNYPATFVAPIYPLSLDAGNKNLKAAISKYTNGCRSTRIVLMGYSQGAHVIGDVVVQISATQRSRIAGIGLIGDPMFNRSLSGSTTKNATNRGGMLGRRSSWPSGLYVTNVCNTGDRVCGALNALDGAPGPGSTQHQQYTTTTYSPVSGRSGANAIGYNLGGRS